MKEIIHMPLRKQFIRFASICCFLSVITTLGIHAWFPDPPADFEERILLFRDKSYLLNRWWVIVHCLLVIVSVWGFALLQMKKAPGFTGLGLTFFIVFGIAEITRQMIVLFYTNGLREQYFTATDTGVKDGLRILLSYAGLLTYPLFGVFILSFGLGSLFYGLSLSLTRGFSQLLSIMLIISGLASFVMLANEFWKIAAISRIIEIYSYTFTPLLRVVTGVWLWKKSNEAVAKV
jgi:hypothetical protein